MTSDLSNLAQMAKLAALRAEKELHALREQEHALRSQLKELEQRRQNTKPRDLEHLSLQAVGGDILWQTWLDRRRSEINSQLARVLAEKQNRLPKIKRSMGRKSATEEILRRAHLEQKQQLAKQQEDNRMETLAIKSARAQTRR